MPESEASEMPDGLRIVLTYGTYDMLHHGHIRLLKRASELGDYLIVGLSTDEFNKVKGKESFFSYERRKEILESIRYVDRIIPETTWDQKQKDVVDHKVDVVVMGDDWKENKHFEELRSLCEVVYLPRTEGISTTKVRRELKK